MGPKPATQSFGNKPVLTGKRFFCRWGKRKLPNNHFRKVPEKFGTFAEDLSLPWARFASAEILLRKPPGTFYWGNFRFTRACLGNATKPSPTRLRSLTALPVSIAYITGESFNAEKKGTVGGGGAKSPSAFPGKALRNFRPTLKRTGGLQRKTRRLLNNFPGNRAQ